MAKRHGHCVQRVSLDRAVAAENATLQGVGLTHVSPDLAETFDRVPRDVLLRVWTHFNMPRGGSGFFR